MDNLSCFLLGAITTEAIALAQQKLKLNRIRQYALNIYWGNFNYKIQTDIDDLLKELET